MTRLLVTKSTKTPNRVRAYSYRGGPYLIDLYNCTYHLGVLVHPRRAGVARSMRSMLSMARALGRQRWGALPLSDIVVHLFP